MKNTEILITDDIWTTKNNDSGVIWKTKAAFIGRNNRPSLPLKSFDDLRNTRNLQIKYKDKIIPLPEKLGKKLVDYFRLQPYKNTSFDCASFAHYLNDIPYIYGNFNDDEWNFSRLSNEKSLKAGDSIILSQDSRSDVLTHMAIYLSDGIYISKFGLSGKLMFATLKDMKEGYNSNFVFKVRKKRNIAKKLILWLQTSLGTL